MDKTTVLAPLGLGAWVGLGVLLLAWVPSCTFGPASGGPVQKPKQSLQPGDLAAIEGAIRLQLSDIKVVEEAALLRGKDSVLYLRLAVPADEAAGLLATVRGRSRAIDAARVFDPDPVVPWFAVNGEELGEVFDEGLGVYFAFCKPQGGIVKVYVRVGSMSKRLSAGIYDMF